MTGRPLTPAPGARPERRRRHRCETATADAAEPPPTLHGCPITDSHGAAVVHCNRDDYLRPDDRPEGRRLRDAASTCTGVDYLDPPGAGTCPTGIGPERFEVVVDLLSLSLHRQRLRVRCQVPEADP